MTFSLPQAFDLQQPRAPQLIAFTGAGGKTSLLLALAGSLPGKIVITTTTHMAREQIDSAAASLPAAVTRYPSISSISCTRITAVVGPDVAHGRVAGVDPDVPAKLLAQPDVSYVLVEADGARLLPLKAPAAHEPAVPPGATLVVPVAGIDALGRPIAVAAHRPQRAAALLGKGIDELVAAPDLALILTHAQGGLKGVPSEARVIAVINKVEDEQQRAAACAAAGAILAEPRVERVVLAAAERPQPVREVWRRVTAVILAAGESNRMGRPKLLLPWGEQTLLGQTLANVRRSSVFDSVVITGDNAPAVAGIARRAGVPTLFNEHFASREMLSSLQLAIRHLPPRIAAVLVMLGDQPLVEAETIDLILAAYFQGQGEIIAPEFGGRRGNPVLIGRPCFGRILALPRGSAPRDLLRAYPPHLVPVASESVLLDIDDPQTYERLRPR